MAASYSKSTALTPALLLTIFILPLSATTIRVPQDQPTIQAGINAAVNRDTVLVAPGTYFESLNFNGRSIVLKSAYGPDSTILRPAGGPIIRLVSGEDTSATIDGFKLVGGSAPNGGGILFNNSSGSAVNNVFDSCTATGGSSGNGGAIACIGALSRVRISNNVIKNGLGGTGGGIGQADAVFCWGSTVEISGNLIIDNTSTAVIFAYTASNVKIINNTIANTPTDAFALFCYEVAPADVRNNIFFNNPYGVLFDEASVYKAEYNDFYATPVYLGRKPPGAGNISQNPLFMGGTPFSYQLQASSPCIDAGDPSSPVPPSGGTRVDIGAFEFKKNFALFLPRGNIVVRKPQFIWSGLQDSAGIVPSHYRLFLAPNCDFSLADSSTSLSDTVWKVPNRLNVNQNYCWKVSFISDSSDTIVSDSVAFKVLNPALTPLRPVQSETLRIRRPTFIWKSVSDTSISESFAYRVVLSKDAGFVVTDTSPSRPDTVWKVDHILDENLNYFWKVIAATDSGDTVFSPVKSFIVFPTLRLKLPADSSRVLVTQPTFTWEAVRDTSIPDLFTYQVFYSKNSNFTDATSSPILSDTFWQPPLPLEAGHTYYWKILAFYSSIADTIRSSRDFRFLLAPTKIEVPGDRPTIQQAIDISLNGDTVWVKPGTYYEHIFFKGKRIKVISEGGPQATTIAKNVDGLELVNITSSEDINTVLSGFTLTGASDVEDGAAIRIVNASPRVENNHIVGNSVSMGIWVDNGFPKIQRCLIAKNACQAAVRFYGAAGGEVINCTISDNSGDGIQVGYGVSLRVTNCIITFNLGYGIRSLFGNNTFSAITYDNIYGNSAGHFFEIQPSTGILNADPLFVGSSPFNYRLASFSPCIDAGDPAFPVPPGGGTRIDIGAFEFVPTLGDLNGDGAYSATDIVLLLNCVFHQTGSCNFAMTDMNCDGQITGADIVLELGLIFQQIPLPC